MYGRVLESKLDMIEFVRGCGFELADSPEDRWLKISSVTL